MKKEHKRFAQAVLNELRKELSLHPYLKVQVSIQKTTKKSKLDSGQYVFRFRYKLTSYIEDDLTYDTLYHVERLYENYKEDGVSIEEFAKKFLVNYVLHLVSL